MCSPEIGGYFCLSTCSYFYFVVDGRDTATQGKKHEFTVIVNGLSVEGSSFDDVVAPRKRKVSAYSGRANTMRHTTLRRTRLPVRQGAATDYNSYSSVSTDFGSPHPLEDNH